MSSGASSKPNIVHPIAGESRIPESLHPVHTLRAHPILFRYLKKSYVALESCLLSENLLGFWRSLISARREELPRLCENPSGCVQCRVLSA